MKTLLRSLLRSFLCIASFWLLGFSPFSASAQNPEPTLQTVIKVDLSTRLFEKNLPFDEAFNIKGAFPEGVGCVLLTMRPLNYTNLKYKIISIWPERMPNKVKPTEFRFTIPPLTNDVKYEFRFQMYAGKTITTPKQPTKIDIVEKQMRTPQVLKRFEGTLMEPATTSTDVKITCGLDMKEEMRKDPNIKEVEDITVTTNPRSTFTQHFTTDFGVLRSFKAQYWGVYSGVHFYFAPINKNADLLPFDGTFELRLKKRVSMFVGIAFEEIGSKTEVDIENLTSIGTPVVGIGVRGIFRWGIYRALFGKSHTDGAAERARRRRAIRKKVLQPFRLNVGVLFFRQQDAHPLVMAKRTKADFFISLTANINLITVAGPLVALFK